MSNCEEQLLVHKLEDALIKIDAQHLIDDVVNILCNCGNEFDQVTIECGPEQENFTEAAFTFNNIKLLKQKFSKKGNEKMNEALIKIEDEIHHNQSAISKEY